MKNNGTLHPATVIEIPRAGFVGSWGDFRRDNRLFINETEMDRIGRKLEESGVATHTAHTAGDFVFVRHQTSKATA